MINNKDIAKSIDEGLKILKQEPSFIFNLEEIKAIEVLESFEYREKTKQYNKLDLGDVRTSKVLLNLINRLQKELDKKDKEYKELETLVENYEEGLDIKDRVIHLMAKPIAGLELYDFIKKEYFTLENEDEVIVHFYKKVEEEN